ncbi:acetolactate synthase large subunit [bacterium LRH843]|nr:acetolactate synthase large subunit [bacterium LRH843]
MKATDVFIQCLENEGVEYIFGIPGKETLDLVDSISRSGIKFINVRHEQGAAFMADVYGRLSNHVGVCLATLGPGATNLVTGLASATLDHSPVVAIVGQAATTRQHKESHQFLNIKKLMEPVTKWSVEVKDSTTIPEIIRRAFQLAANEKPGTVVVELPEDIATCATPPVVLSVTQSPETMPIIKDLEKAYSLIQQSQKPFIVVGNGAIRQEAVKELKAFIERMQCPVTHSFKAKGILPKDHPLNYYTFGFQEKDEVVRGMAEADLLIVIGFDFIERLPQNWNIAKVPIIHIDALTAQVDEYYPVQLELVGDLKHTLNHLNTFDDLATPWVPTKNLKMQIEQIYHIDWNHVHLSSLTTENILHVIEKLSCERTIVISDVGTHKLSIARTYQPKEPNQLIISNGLASMGIAIPGSIGAKLACPDAPVICITGDGGALTNFAEIETATRLGLSLIIIVLNDSTLKLEQQMMEQAFGNSHGVTFGNPDFVQLAQSFGVKGVQANDLSQFEEILTLHLKSPDGIVLIDVPLSPSNKMP